MGIQLSSFLIVIIHVEDVPAKVGLCDLSIDHEEVQHRHYLEQNLLLEVHIGYGLESKEAFFALGLARCLLYEL